MNFQTMNKQRKFVLIAAAIGLISCFLPWVTISIDIFGISKSNSANGLDNWRGIFALLAFAGAGVVAFMGDQTKTMDQKSWFIALACGAIAALGTLLFLLKIDTGFGVSYGFGIFIALAAAIAVVASAYMFRSPGVSIKGGFDSLKSDIEKKTDGNPNT